MRHLGMAEFAVEEHWWERTLRPRHVAMFMYTMYFLASFCFIFFPTTDTVRDSIYSIFILTFHIFLSGGAVISMAGAMRKIPLVEVIGVPLQMAACIVYGVILFAVDSPNRGSTVGIGFLFMGAAVGLGLRAVQIIGLQWIEHNLVRREAE